MANAVRIEGLGKRYRVGETMRYRALRDSIAAGMYAPYRAARSLARRKSNGNGAGPALPDHIWALRGLSLEVPPGEIVGVIGRNGAGKSTLLKVISRVTEPTEGMVELRGRVGSLLEVGTGFHQELTGRENVYLSGAILGMRKAEIKRKFDEIVEFSGVQRFIDTPVKRYSSGMHLRLGFAVAAHLDAEIMLVDEVLAVGDAEFQKRCLGKIDTAAHEGRTVFCVSHNMTAINQLCERTILLVDGQVAQDGPTTEVIHEYLRLGSEQEGRRVWDEPDEAPGNDRIRLHAVRIVSGGEPRATVNIDQEMTVELEFWNREPGIRNLAAVLVVNDRIGRPVLYTVSTPSANAVQEEWFDRPHPAGLFRASCTLPPNFLNEGRHYVSVALITLGPEMVEAVAPDVVAFDVFDTGVMREPGAARDWPGAVRPRLPWRTELLDEPQQ